MRSRFAAGRIGEEQPAAIGRRAPASREQARLRRRLDQRGVGRGRRPRAAAVVAGRDHAGSSSAFGGWLRMFSISRPSASSTTWLSLVPAPRCAERQSAAVVAVDDVRAVDAGRRLGVVRGNHEPAAAESECRCPGPVAYQVQSAASRWR